MESDFEMRRGERRSFFCDNKLWNKILNITKDKISISTYIKQAIEEKMKREDPQGKEYYERLLINSDNF